MPVARNPGSTSLVDILDRVLDQGIRFAPEAGAALARPPAPAQGGRIAVESVETHLAPSGVPPGKTGTGA
jgi:gas vesicle structural protein